MSSHKHPTFPLSFSTWDHVGDFEVQLYDTVFTEQFGPFYPGQHGVVCINYVAGTITSYNNDGDDVLSCKFKCVPV